MKTMRFALVTSALALVAATAVEGQIELEITPFAGGALFLADPPNQFALERTVGDPLLVTDGAFDNAWTVGANIGLRINERWAVEGLFSWLPTDLTATSGLSRKAEVNGYMYGLTALYYIPIGSVVTPFVGVGVGGETFDYKASDLKTEHEFMGNVVGGLYFTMTDAVGFRLEARDCFARFDSGVTGVDDAWENDLMITAGISFRTPIR